MDASGRANRGTVEVTTVKVASGRGEEDQDIAETARQGAKGAIAQCRKEFGSGI
jgi:hypothetical protein